MYCCHNTGIEFQDFKFSVLNNSVTLTRYRPTPWWWPAKIETCRSTFMYFHVFLTLKSAFWTTILLNVKCMCWCLSITELKNARWNIKKKIAFRFFERPLAMMTQSNFTWLVHILPSPREYVGVSCIRVRCMSFSSNNVTNCRTL